MTKENKYQNGKIYKITDNNYTKCYIGSTVQKYLSMRMGKHRTQFQNWLDEGEGFLSAFEIFEEFGVENCKIELIEAFPCQSKDELLKQEGLHIRSTVCVNRQIPARSKKEYSKLYSQINKEKFAKHREENKEKLQEYFKNHHELNKERINQQRREYYEENKDKVKQQNKKYREDNKEKTQERNRNYNALKIVCPVCSTQVGKSQILRHQSSKKCKLLNSQQP